MLLRLRLALAGRKWILWLALLFLLLILWWVGLALLPHNVLNTLLQYEEKSNGLRNPPIRNAPAMIAFSRLA
jgi:hypothetical protein